MRNWSLLGILAVLAAFMPACFSNSGPFDTGGVTTTASNGGTGGDTSTSTNSSGGSTSMSGGSDGAGGDTSTSTSSGGGVGGTSTSSSGGSGGVGGTTTSSSGGSGGTGGSMIPTCATGELLPSSVTVTGGTASALYVHAYGEAAPPPQFDLSNGNTPLTLEIPSAPAGVVTEGVSGHAVTLNYSSGSGQTGESFYLVSTTGMAECLAVLNNETCMAAVDLSWRCQNAPELLEGETCPAKLAEFTFQVTNTSYNPPPKAGTTIYYFLTSCVSP